MGRWAGGAPAACWAAASPPTRCPLVCSVRRSPSFSTLVQMTNALSYYFGVLDIPDSMVVNDLLGVPTYLLHDYVFASQARKHANRGPRHTRWAAVSATPAGRRLPWFMVHPGHASPRLAPVLQSIGQQAAANPLVQMGLGLGAANPEVVTQVGGWSSIVVWMLRPWLPVPARAPGASPACRPLAAGHLLACPPTHAPASLPSHPLPARPPSHPPALLPASLPSRPAADLYDPYSTPPCHRFRQLPTHSGCRTSSSSIPSP